jgi:alkanesulfonate monooxygenase SsuD/methylene tetrahydromethanopterin reductase-like flavin-dependent oxidoreductase (luciferase family)
VLVMAMIDQNATEDLIPDEVRQNVVFGGPDQVADQIKSKVLDAGVDGVILSPITSLNGYQPGDITAVAEKLRPLVAA